MESNSKEEQPLYPIVLNNNPRDAITIAEFLANKNVFVTGGTGFLGAILIEALLSATPSIGKIYMLIRGKRNSDPKKRIEKLLEKPIFQSHSKETLSKIIPVTGELAAPKFGFDDDLWNELIDSVNVIYHSAATIKFNCHLRDAIQTNLVGTLRTIELAKQLKTLSAYIYISTAFCNSNRRGYIWEKVYPSVYDPYAMIKMSESDQGWPLLSKGQRYDWAPIIKDHPNTYTFTKQLAETLIMKELSGYPSGIVRPSIVYGTYEKPVVGWVGNANSGHLGFLAGYAKGIFRTMAGNPTAVIDIIPCDYVINSAMVLSCYVGTNKLPTPEVIHCTSGESNPLTLEAFRDICNTQIKKHPCDNMVWKPHTEIRNGLRYTLFVYLVHILPAMFLHLPEKIFRFGNPLHTSFEFMRIFNKGHQAFIYFLNNDFRYSLKNAQRLKTLIHPKDAKAYPFDSRECEWPILFERCFLGLRRYFYRESIKTTEKHHLLFKFLELLHYCSIFASYIALYVVFYFIFNTTTCLVLTTLIWSFFLWL